MFLATSFLGFEGWVGTVVRSIVSTFAVLIAIWWIFDKPSLDEILGKKKDKPISKKKRKKRTNKTKKRQKKAKHDWWNLSLSVWV